MSERCKFETKTKRKKKWETKNCFFIAIWNRNKIKTVLISKSSGHCACSAPNFHTAQRLQAVIWALTPNVWPALKVAQLVVHMGMAKWCLQNPKFLLLNQWKRNNRMKSKKAQYQDCLELMSWRRILTIHLYAIIYHVKVSNSPYY